ncbi:sigma-70 family RNA polymerase sigma factor [Planococcus lenghuensis]|uniref:Sigma-70 family RNA polymerase sigma factor n=1 Tax=Planococcus lenghuensis TaxID=2213202 RepID=A0A1Q2KZ87_9BACL|nr:sigma-70 family RNA polymerase sigma factor [Planococcus lenghuensis]AQQ53117.1 hypothetical protein B0X71_08425 [Planococcus lenghuensis]
MDEEDIQRASAQADDVQLLDDLMRTYGPELKRIAYLYVHDRTECEDIIQEVFTSCFKNSSRFRHEAEYKTWLTRITINKCRDHQRRWSFRNLIYKSAIRSADMDHSAETHVIAAFDSAQLARSLFRLTPKFKDVLILYYYQELTMKEIAAVLDISINTVKSRLLRGKKALQEQLERSEQRG